MHRAIREQLLPFARRHYPHLNAAFDKQPYPRPGNLFVVRYCASSQRPGGFAACSLRCGPGSLRAVPRAPAAPGDRPSPSFRRCDRRGLKLHKDETALTFNLCLSPEDGFTGGGTYFPANSADVDGILLRPKPGCCLIHDGCANAPPPGPRGPRQPSAFHSHPARALALAYAHGGTATFAPGPFDNYSYLDCRARALSHDVAGTSSTRATRWSLGSASSLWASTTLMAETARARSSELPSNRSEGGHFS